MTTITPYNIATAPINWNLLPEDFRGEKHNVELYSKHYNHDPQIKEQVDALIEIINDALSKAEKVSKAKPIKAERKKRETKPAAKAAPKKKKAAPAVKKAKPRKAKKAAPAKKPSKKKVIAKRVAVKAVKPPKAPITVKKLSQELQLIKSFAYMKGKNRSVSSVKTLLKKVDAAIPIAYVSEQKAILKEIKAKMQPVLDKLAKSITTLTNINISDALYDRCMNVVLAAKPRMTVQYFSGLPSGK